MEKIKTLLKYCSTKFKNTKIKIYITKILHNNSIYFTNILMCAKLLIFTWRNISQLKLTCDDTCLVLSVFCHRGEQMASAVY